MGADSPHNVTGTATHLGKYSRDGRSNVLTLHPSTLSVKSVVHFALLKSYQIPTAKP